MPGASAVEFSVLASQRKCEHAKSDHVVLLQDFNSETEIGNAKNDASKIHEPDGFPLARKTFFAIVSCYISGNHRLIKVLVETY
jgi:hypothetical protein